MFCCLIKNFIFTVGLNEQNAFELVFYLPAFLTNIVRSYCSLLLLKPAGTCRIYSVETLKIIYLTRNFYLIKL